MMFIIIYQVLYIWLTVVSAQTGLSLEEVKRVTINLSHGGGLEGIQWRIDGDKSVDAYLGIPFAEPPIGKLRFAPPQPIRPWTGTRNAMTRCKACVQYNFGSFDNANLAAKIWVNNTEMSEDCLYLNVWTPSSKSDGSKAVMVWIYGGGYFSGTPNLDIYDGRFLVAMEDVVVVSMNYRLGPFGFLYLKSHVEGNMGLKDQQLALKWVKDNIAVFNGDPDRITVFGESAGAVSVSLQYLNPNSRSYFNRFILQSGGAFNRWALSTADDAHETGISVRTGNIFEMV
nr:acetylcholinesterase [Hymenolepis microstoma]